MTASFRPVAAMLASRRLRYGLVSVNFSGSVDVSPASCSSQSPSNSVRSRSAALSRKWCAHFGQTLQVGGEILVVDDLAAGRTLDPQPFGHAALVRRLDRLAGLLEPRHLGEHITSLIVDG